MSSGLIYIVEDEIKIAQILVDYLVKDNYDVKVLYRGDEAVERILESKPDLVILDVMLPGKSGINICKELREHSNVPIMMLTARIDEMDRLVGLKVGADDYVCKPFLPREVVARVNAILRRVNRIDDEEEKSTELVYRSITLDLECFKCHANGQYVELTPVEYRLLQIMVSRPKRVFSRESLMQKCYKDDRIVSDRTIDSHVKNLRKKLAAADPGEEVIHSIYGVGYKVE